MSLECEQIREYTVIFDDDNSNAYLKSDLNCADYLLLGLDDLPQ